MKRTFALNGEPNQMATVLREAPVRQGWDGVEIPGYVVSEDTRLLDQLEALELPALMVRSMPDDHTTRHLPDARTVARKPLTAYLREGVSRMAMFELHTMSLDLGCDRIRPDDEAEAISMRVNLLRELMPMAEAHDVTVCLPVRVPASLPGGRAEKLTESVMHELGHPNCKLVLDVILEEVIEPPFDIFRRWPLTGAAFRLHYEPELGILPDETTLAGWFEAAGRASFRGLLTFAPHTSSPSSMITELSRLAKLL